jgi:hypothetical protein
MSSIVDVLNAKRAELNEQIALAKEELKKVEVALKAIQGAVSAGAERPTPKQGHKVPNGNHSGLTVDQAMLEAVKSGAQVPREIHKFIEQHLAVKTTLGSVSTRLWKLRKEKKIKHDGHKWVVAEKKEAPAEQLEALLS